MTPEAPLPSPVPLPLAEKIDISGELVPAYCLTPFGLQLRFNQANAIFRDITQPPQRHTAAQSLLDLAKNLTHTLTPNEVQTLQDIRTQMTAMLTNEPVLHFRKISGVLRRESDQVNVGADEIYVFIRRIDAYLDSKYHLPPFPFPKTSKRKS